MDMPPQPPRVLVVDDAVTVRRYHGSVVEAAGYAVAEAANGAEALELLLERPVDLMLVDVNMPVMDGCSFLRELRTRPELAAIPAIMVSTEASWEDRRRAWEAGANLYLVKPVDDARLRRVLDLLLGGRG